MRPHALVLLAAVLCAPAIAAPAAALCPSPDGAVCVRVLACIGTAGRWFNGASYGNTSGALAGTMSDGIACSGSWDWGGGTGPGRASVVCDDGLTANVRFVYLDRESGTTLGFGIASTGQTVRSWSGPGVIGYLTPNGSAGASLPCTEAGVPVS